MSGQRGLLQQILARQTGANIRFGDLRGMLLRLGFEERISGSHHIFSKSGIFEKINIQPRRGHVKAYQLQQIRKVVEKYGLNEEHCA